MTVIKVLSKIQIYIKPKHQNLCYLINGFNLGANPKLLWMVWIQSLTQHVEYINNGISSGQRQRLNHTGEFFFFFKGVIGCKIHFYMLFELKCVLAVCEHNHPIMIKIHPVFFFLILINDNPFLKSSRSQILECVTSHRPRPLPWLLIDTSVLP